MRIAWSGLGTLPVVLLLARSGATGSVSNTFKPPELAGSLSACDSCVGSTLSPERQCKAVCQGVLRLAEASVAAPQLRRLSPSVGVSSEEDMFCVALEDCPARKASVSSVCGCCGMQFGMRYPLVTMTGHYGNLSAFKSLRGCSDDVIASNCDTCLLWRKLRGNYVDGPLTSLPCDAGTMCYGTVGGVHTLMATSSGVEGRDPGHWLLLPGSKTYDWAVYGIEDPVVLTEEGEHLWDAAWWCAFDPYNRCLPSPVPQSVPFLPVAHTSDWIGLALNPATARSMHQLHIHIARIPKPLRAALAGGLETFSTWTQLTLQLTGDALQGRNVTLLAKYYSLTPSTAPQSLRAPGPRRHAMASAEASEAVTAVGSVLRPFNKVFAFAGFDPIQMMAWGLMLLPSEVASVGGPYPEGVYMVVGAQHESQDPHVQWWNQYPDNPHMVPEHLLCDQGAMVDGFWHPDDCSSV